MMPLTFNMTFARFALSIGLLCGMVWQATAGDLPELGQQGFEAREAAIGSSGRSTSSTVFLEEREEKGTCRVHIHEIFNSGKKKVNVSDVASYSRGECKSEALLRKLASESKDDIKEVKVYFSFREPAIVNR